MRFLGLSSQIGGLWLIRTLGACPSIHERGAHDLGFRGLCAALRFGPPASGSAVLWSADSFASRRGKVTGPRFMPVSMSPGASAGCARCSPTSTPG